MASGRRDRLAAWGGLPSVAALLLMGAVGGCSVTGKSASMDSISRMPFMNLELAPKPRDPVPETQRI